MNNEEIAVLGTGALGGCGLVSLVFFLAFGELSYAAVTSVLAICFAINVAQRAKDSSEARYKAMEELVVRAEAKYEDNQKRMATLQTDLTQVRMALSQPAGHWQ